MYLCLQVPQPADVIYTEGCMSAGEKWFNQNLIPVAGVFVAIALVQVKYCKSFSCWFLALCSCPLPCCRLPLGFFRVLFVRSCFLGMLFTSWSWNSSGLISTLWFHTCLYQLMMLGHLKWNNFHYFSVGYYCNRGPVWQSHTIPCFLVVLSKVLAGVQ